MSQLGQKAKYSLRADVFRLSSESGLRSDIAPRPRSANNRNHGCKPFVKKRPPKLAALRP